MNDRAFIAQTILLSEIKETQDRNHPQLVGAIENLLEAQEVCRARRAIWKKSGVVPRLNVLAVAVRAAALQIDGERNQPRLAPGRHGSDKFRSIALRIPRPIGVIPAS